ncbi:MAG: metallophosphoesterase [Spirochaetales bacterium]|nr:metallophosphoesterase [Spirochaetales bacterium]
MSKIIHTADIHFCKKEQDKVFLSLSTLCEYGKKENIDLIVIAGDLTHEGIFNTRKSGLPGLQEMIKNMLDIAPVVVVYGTPTHDLPGCYEIFAKIKAGHNFTILKPGIPYFLIEKNVYSFNDEEINPGNASLLILGCPEPQKTWLLANKPGIGKEESDKAAIDGMRELFLGFGALRKQYPRIPCIFTGHLEISNALTCSGHILQKSVQLGKDDLCLIGADYYALGHIHLAQEVIRHKAWYSGSAYPVDWGETDRKGFNLVELKPGVGNQINLPQITRIPFPHPPRKKIVLSSPGTLPDKKEIEGFQVWLDIKVPKDGKEPDISYHHSMLMNIGALTGSKVTVSIIPVETVRAGGIQEVKRLKDKVKIYAENSNQKITEVILEKADLLEIEARREGLAGEGLAVRVKKIILRGATGIWKGQGREEIELDLDRYDPGLIALAGRNGAGKTTLIENMQPYTTLLTRKTQKLQDHFILRDSYRDLYFVDENTGTEYRAFIQVDGKNKTGKAEYYLYQKNGRGYIPVTNARKEDYEKKINELYGSFTLFVQSAFISQKPFRIRKDKQDLPSDISEGTPKQRKTFFSELAGINYIQAYSELAKGKAKTLEIEITRDSGRIDSFEELIKNLPQKIEELQTTRSRYNNKTDELTDLEKQGKEAKEEVERLSLKVQENKRISEQIVHLKNQLEDLSAEKEKIERDITEYKKALSKEQEAEMTVQKYNRLKEREAQILNEEKAVLQKREKLTQEYNKKLQDIIEQKNQLNEELDKITEKITDKQRQKDRLINDIDYINEKLEEKLECPECGCKFSRDQKALEKELSGKQETVIETDKEIIQFERERKKLKTKISELKYPDKPELPEFDDEELLRVNGDIEFLSIEESREIIQLARTAKTRIEESNKRTGQITDQSKKLRNELDPLKPDPEIEGKHTNALQKYEDIKQSYRDCRDEVQRLTSDIKNLENQIGELRKQEKELTTLKVVVEKKRREIHEWEWLAKACGPDGIQALELDALAPDIAASANRILESAYGSRFQIEFRTTRIGGRGANTKQIEDFLIIIHDLKAGTEQEVSTLSGGESVWIKKAIYDAFGIIRARNTGTKFLTVFQDETDGALDSEAKKAYFKMLQAAHNESGRYHTIVITHSPEAQSMIPQKIEISELAGTVTNEVEKLELTGANHG